MRGKLFRCRVSENKRLAERGPRPDVMPVWALEDPSEVWSCQHPSGKSCLLRRRGNGWLFVLPRVAISEGLCLVGEGQTTGGKPWASEAMPQGVCVE